jgi:hypothetical protein
MGDASSSDPEQTHAGNAGEDGSGTMTSVGIPVGPDQHEQQPRSELSRAHHSACSARYARRHGRSADTRHRGGSSAHGRRHAVSSRYLNNAAVIDRQVADPHPARRQVITCMVITVALGLLYVVLAGVFWPDMNRELFWAGLLLIVFGGLVCENAIRFDAVRGAAGLSATKPVGQQ